MMSNYACMGYAKEAVNYMIDEGEITHEQGKRLLTRISSQFDFWSEEEAEKYYDEACVKGQD